MTLGQFALDLLGLLCLAYIVIIGGDVLIKGFVYGDWGPESGPD